MSVNMRKSEHPSEIDNLIAQLGMMHRRKTVASLLAGNDTQCFTTQQYVERYHKIAHRGDPKFRDTWIKWQMTLVPEHMQSVGCVEVKPGVWTKKENIK